MIKILFVILSLLILTCSCNNDSKIRKEILNKANNEMTELVDKAINVNTVGEGTTNIDNFISPEKKQQIIDKNLLPRFRDFLQNTNDIDSLRKMNSDKIFRYNMIIKSTTGGTSEDALKVLYEKVVDKNKIRKEILTKADTELTELVDKAINANTAGLGSLIIDNFIPIEKKQQIIERNLLPRFRDFLQNTNDVDSLSKMNSQNIFRYEMILKSTIGNDSKKALRTLYKEIISIDL